MGNITDMDQSKNKLRDGDTVLYDGKLGLYVCNCIELYETPGVINPVDKTKLTLLA